MQMKATKRYYYTSIRKAAIWNTDNPKYRRGCGVKGTLTHCWRDCKMVWPLWRTVWQLLRKLNLLSPYDPTLLLPDVYPKKLKAYVHTKTDTKMFIAAYS